MTNEKISPTFSNAPAPNFALQDHKQVSHSLRSVNGHSGLILGFIGDIWKPISVHRILGLQRNASKLEKMGISLALVVRDRVATLANFHLSSPLPVPFPLLADPDGKVHEAYEVSTSALLLLVDRGGTMRYKWQMPNDAVWPALNDLVLAVQSVQRLANPTGVA